MLNTLKQSRINIMRGKKGTQLHFPTSLFREYIYIYIYTYIVVSLRACFHWQCDARGEDSAFRASNHVIFFSRMSGCCHCYCERLENYSRLSDYTVRLQLYRMIGQKISSNVIGVLAELFLTSHSVQL